MGRFLDTDTVGGQEIVAPQTPEVPSAEPQPTAITTPGRFLDDAEAPIQFREQQPEPRAGVLGQFRLGAQETATEFRRLIGAPEGAIRRLQVEPEAEPVGLVEKTARLAGEFIAPIPELGGIPGVGFLIAAGEKAVGRGIAKIGAPFVERVGRPIAKTISDSKVFNATKELFTKIGQGVSDSAIDRVGDIMKFTSGVNEKAAIRLMRRGNEAWKKSYVEAGKEAFTKSNREKASTGITEAFSVVGKEFDKEVAPALRSKVPVDTEGLRAAFNDVLIQSDLIERIVKNGKLQAGIADIDEELVKVFSKIQQRLIRVEKDGTVKAAHEFKKSLSNLINSKKIRENPTAKRALIGLKDETVSRIENVSENYRLVNQRFRNIFEIEDLIGNKLNPRNIEQAAFNLYGKGQSFLRENLILLDDFLPTNKKFYNDLLDESAVKQFVDIEPQWFRGLAFAGIGGGGTIGPGAVAGLALSSPRAQALAIRGTQAGGRRLGALVRGARQFPTAPGIPAAVTGRAALQRLTAEPQR